MALSHSITNKKHCIPGERATLERWAVQAAALEAENAQLRTVATAAAHLYRALGHHGTTVHPAPAPAPVLPLGNLYRALLAAGYTDDGNLVVAEPVGTPVGISPPTAAPWTGALPGTADRLPGGNSP
jgi:hypothetical protein